MGKLKTHKSTAKRFKISKSGKLMHDVSGFRHMKAKKAARIKYRKNVRVELDKSVAKNIKKLLPGVSI